MAVSLASNSPLHKTTGAEFQLDTRGEAQPSETGPERNQSLLATGKGTQQLGQTPATEAVAALLGRAVRYYPSLRQIGHLSCRDAIFLSQLLYWTAKRKRDPAGWIYKSYAEFTEETGLQRGQLNGARVVLRDLGILEEHRRGTNGVLRFRVNLQVLETLLSRVPREPERASRANPDVETREPERASRANPYKEAVITTGTTSTTTNNGVVDSEEISLPEPGTLDDAMAEELLGTRLGLDFSEFRRLLEQEFRSESIEHAIREFKVSIAAGDDIKSIKGWIRSVAEKYEAQLARVERDRTEEEAEQERRERARRECPHGTPRTESCDECLRVKQEGIARAKAILQKAKGAVNQ